MAKIVRFTLRGIAGLLMFGIVWFGLYLYQQQQVYAVANPNGAAVYTGVQCMVVVPIAGVAILMAWFLSWLSTKV